MPAPTYSEREATMLREVGAWLASGRPLDFRSPIVSTLAMSWDEYSWLFHEVGSIVLRSLGDAAIIAPSTSTSPIRFQSFDLDFADDTTKRPTDGAADGADGATRRARDD